MASLRLKHVQAFVDRHGRARHYYRRPGFKRVALPGLPGSPEFMAAYAEASVTPAPPVGLRQIRPGTINALAVSYFGSRAFRKLAPTTQTSYRGFIDRLCEQDGDKPVAGLQRRHVIAMMEQRNAPVAANAILKMLRALMKHAVDTGFRQDNPARDVSAIPIKTEGYHSWSEEEIAKFEAAHPIGSAARLAFALLLHTGQRRGDVIRMGPQHIRDGFLHVKQAKTGTELYIPVTPQLAETIAASPVNQLAFIVSDLGKSYTATGFSNRFRKDCDKAGLPHCTAHGLRKAAARRLAEAGCTEHEIKSITGHASLKEVARYTKGVNQRRLAMVAMEKVRVNETGSTGVKPEPSNPDQIVKPLEKPLKSHGF